MTQHSKIDSTQVKPASLFERADALLGGGALSGRPVPADLPPARKPAAPAPAPQSERPSPIAVSEQGESVAFTGPHLAIDREKLREEGLIIPEEAATALLEEFRIVKRELLADARASVTGTANRVLVSSPHAGEGKTYCAVNLAIALAAEREIEVVLVDADMLDPSIPRRLGVESGPGLMDVLSDESIAPESLVSPTDIGGLHVLSAGHGSVRDTEYLAGGRIEAVLERLTRGAPNRFLIFDTPPALAASPAAELAAHVGQALLVVRADETAHAALDDARQLLSACPDIKLLLNAARFSPSGRRFGDYGHSAR
jgi:Mrp family chromosome partitioning ATPase